MRIIAIIHIIHTCSVFFPSTFLMCLRVCLRAFLVYSLARCTHFVFVPLISYLWALQAFPLIARSSAFSLLLVRFPASAAEILVIYAFLSERKLKWSMRPGRQKSTGWEHYDCTILCSPSHCLETLARRMVWNAQFHLLFPVVNSFCNYEFVTESHFSVLDWFWAVMWVYTDASHCVFVCVCMSVWVCVCGFRFMC